MTTKTARERAKQTLESMSLQQKVGQLVQVEGAYGHVTDELRHQITVSGVGSVINEVDPGSVTELQRLAREESPHGIPLLIGRDVIHGFKTVFPIPLGMAATWNVDVVEQVAQVSADEASQQGVNWTFSPMVDISRDPRWGRVAESFGEDPLLSAQFGAAMVRGYQNGSSGQLMACLKHFVGYGACEAGKDYNTTNIPEVELRNVHLIPFKAGVKAGAMSLMPSFSDLNGRPPTGNAWLLRDVLREEWGFDGFVVSDWASVVQLVVHGVAEDDRDATSQAVHAGVNMDMASWAYSHHLENLVCEGRVQESLVDELVLDVLAAKYRIGLFDYPVRSYSHAAPSESADTLARNAAEQSIVLLKNERDLLPLDKDGLRIALLGPLADQSDEQLGTWVFDGDVDRSVSIRQAFVEALGDRVEFESVFSTTRSYEEDRFEEAAEIAERCDVVVLALGEEAILSGEAHCRSNLSLPGAQLRLVSRLRSLNKPLVVVVLAGRPLVIPELVEYADALFYAWHPGSQAGPALVNLLLGDVSPSARLPITLPRAVGQIPLYYAHGHTGKPATPETVIHIDHIDAKSPQTSIGNTSFHLDVDPSPLFPFGYGLTYTRFEYSNLRTCESESGVVGIEVEVSNVGGRDGVETVQLYVRDEVASVTRPVRELKAFQKVTLGVGEQTTVHFDLEHKDLMFFDGREDVFQPGRFSVWVGGDATANLCIELEL